jgi:hypothetical protein
MSRNLNDCCNSGKKFTCHKATATKLDRLVAGEWRSSVATQLQTGDSLKPGVEFLKAALDAAFRN